MGLEEEAASASACQAVTLSLPGLHHAAPAVPLCSNPVSAGCNHRFCLVCGTKASCWLLEEPGSLFPGEGRGGSRGCPPPVLFSESNWGSGGEGEAGQLSCCLGLSVWSRLWVRITFLKLRPEKGGEGNKEEEGKGKERK